MAGSHSTETRLTMCWAYVVFAAVVIACRSLSRCSVILVVVFGRVGCVAMKRRCAIGYFFGVWRAKNRLGYQGATWLGDLVLLYVDLPIAGFWQADAG